MKLNNFIGFYFLSNALHSSIGHNIKSPACQVSDIQYPMSDLLPKCEKLQMAITQQRVIRSASCLVLGCFLASTDYIALFNLIAHELHRPTS